MHKCETKRCCLLLSMGQGLPVLLNCINQQIRLTYSVNFTYFINTCNWQPSGCVNFAFHLLKLFKLLAQYLGIIKPKRFGFVLLIFVLLLPISSLSQVTWLR